MKHRHTLWVACPRVRHSNTRRIHVGHATWRVVDNIRSQTLETAGTRLDIFHGFFFFACFFFIKLWANIHKAHCNLYIILKKL